MFANGHGDSNMDTSNAIQREALSLAEVSAATGLGRTKLYEAISAGKLRARKCGSRTLVLRDDLRAFLASLPPAV